ncbi:HEPN domain-containing protein [Sedimentimonas flavescens]|uniref:HEPN domain-containing protein n=1 Tax=Sedimentimonas flavescens TaxID=2851012 RepID=UPI0021A45E47|nr:HEPN domain-containing protein [Sedimentimonas flavescens]MCT2538765.1 HEPN domain-containing protein [Sedimentimonas flavescens]
MTDTLNFDALKTKQRALREGFPETMGLRVHRAISWIGRAEDFREDDDSRFIFLWIAFNAAYADEREFQAIPQGERATFLEFFGKLSALDTDRRIYKAVWQRFSGPVRLLLENRYVFNPFWQHHNGIEGFDDWQGRFRASSRSFAQAFQTGDSARVLSAVFDRLYVLRNQLVHGGATWNSGVNRSQVRDGAAILGFLLPIFIDLMMDNPHENWGRPFYPVIGGQA